MHRIFQKLPLFTQRPALDGIPTLFKAREGEDAWKSNGAPPQLHHCQYKLAPKQLPHMAKGCRINNKQKRSLTGRKLAGCSDVTSCMGTMLFAYY